MCASPEVHGVASKKYPCSTVIAVGPDQIIRYHRVRHNDDSRDAAERSRRRSGRSNSGQTHLVVPNSSTFKSGPKAMAFLKIGSGPVVYLRFADIRTYFVTLSNPFLCSTL